MSTLTETQLAERWGLTTRTLQSWRKDGKGPNFVRLGERSIFYRAADVEAYEAARVVGKVDAWRSPVRRAAGALDMLAGKATTPKAKATITSIRDELLSLLD